MPSRERNEKAHTTRNFSLHGLRAKKTTCASEFSLNLEQAAEEQIEQGLENGNKKS